jgi:hypothetical protein
MTLGNMMYLGMISDRIPIIPPFVAAHHINWESTPLPFSKVFDLPRLRKETGKEFLEWHEVKMPSSDVVEVLGCWSIWETMHPDEGPHVTPTPRALKLG